MSEAPMDFTMNGVKYIVATDDKPETMYIMDSTVHYFPINYYVKGAIKLDPLTDPFDIKETVRECDHFIIRCETPDEWVKVPKQIGINVLTETIDKQIKHWVRQKDAYLRNMNIPNSCKKSIKQLLTKIDERLDKLTNEKLDMIFF